jgi:hypothetical protein
MNSETTARPRFARRRKFVIFGVLGVLAVGLCIYVAILESRAEERRAWAEIQKRLDAIRAAGEPLTAEDLAKLYPDPPPERDAALLLAPAVAAFREPEESNDMPFIGSGELPHGSESLTQLMLTNIEAVLSDNQAALNAIQWDKITNAWFGSGLALGLTNWPVYHTYRAMMLGKMLCLEAVVEAESGNGSQASVTLLHALALFRMFRSEYLLYHNTRRFGENLCCQTLERVLNQAAIPADDLSTLERLLSDDHPEGVREALMVMRCRAINDLTMLRENPISELEDFNSFDSKLEIVKTEIHVAYLRMSGRLYSDADFTEMLDLRAAQFTALKLPPKERFAELDRISKQIASEHRRRTLGWNEQRDVVYVHGLLRMDAEVIAKLQVAGVALEIERWRLAHGGRAPDSLADLTPQFAPSIPLDPFDNNPLRYKKLPQGFLVYSIGADFTDDGGKAKTGDEDDTDHYDITFSVER